MPKGRDHPADRGPGPRGHVRRGRLDPGSFDGLRVLDLYAGSGAAGLEALSRGASRALFVETDAKARPPRSGPTSARSRSTAAQLAQDRVERLLARGLPAGEPPYDVAFADPPYALPGDELTAVLATAATRGWLAPGALVIVERASRSEPLRWPDGFSPLQSRRYGEAMLWYATFGD